MRIRTAPFWEWARGFVESPLPKVADFFSNWRRELGIPTDLKRLVASFPEALRQLEPLALPPQRHLLLATPSGWTAFFDNGVNGGDPAPIASYLARVLECRALAVCCRPQTWRPDS